MTDFGECPECGKMTLVQYTEDDGRIRVKCANCGFRKTIKH